MYCRVVLTEPLESGVGDISWIGESGGGEDGGEMRMRGSRCGAGDMTDTAHAT